MLGLVVLAFSMMTITASTMLAYDQRVQSHAQGNLMAGTMERAKAQLLSAVQQNAQSGTTTAPTFTTGSPCAGANNTTLDGKVCPYTESVTYLTSGSTTSLSPTGAVQVADNLNASVTEVRQSFKIQASITDANNGKVVQRSAFVTIRTYNTAPYGDIVGYVDGSSNVSRVMQEGDTAGCDGTSNIVACDVYGSRQPQTQLPSNPVGGHGRGQGQQSATVTDPTNGDTRIRNTAQCQSTANFICQGQQPRLADAYSTTTWTNSNNGGQ